MSLGVAPRQTDVFATTTSFCEGRVAEDSIYAVLHRECFNLFPDSMFADLFTDVGRRSVPPMIVAVVMVLQRIEGSRIVRRSTGSPSMSGGSTPPVGWTSTTRGSCTRCWSTCGPGWRPRSARTGSSRSTLTAAKAAGLVGRKRVLDSTPLYDAVATMDTVTLIRSAIRGLLRAATGTRLILRTSCGRSWGVMTTTPMRGQAGLRLRRQDRPRGADRRTGPRCPRAAGRAGWPRARPGGASGGELLATVVGQDLDRGHRRGLPDRAAVSQPTGSSPPSIPQARHGHKTSANGFDGYKGHLAIDPDSEIITKTTVDRGQHRRRRRGHRPARRGPGRPDETAEAASRRHRRAPSTGEARRAGDERGGVEGLWGCRLRGR